MAENRIRLERKKRKAIEVNIRYLLEQLKILHRDNKFMKSQNTNFIDNLKYFFETYKIEKLNTSDIIENKNVNDKSNKQVKGVKDPMEKLEPLSLNYKHENNAFGDENDDNSEKNGENM